MSFSSLIDKHLLEKALLRYGKLLHKERQDLFEEHRNMLTWMQAQPEKAKRQKEQLHMLQKEHERAKIDKERQQQQLRTLKEEIVQRKKENKRLQTAQQKELRILKEEIAQRKKENKRQQKELQTLKEEIAQRKKDNRVQPQTSIGQEYIIHWENSFRKIQEKDLPYLTPHVIIVHEGTPIPFSEHPRYKANEQAYKQWKQAPKVTPSLSSKQTPHDFVLGYKRENIHFELLKPSTFSLNKHTTIQLKYYFLISHTYLRGFFQFT